MNNDSVLVQNTLKGDTESFSKLVLNYQNRVYNFLLKMTMSKEDAEDIVQEVFIRVYNNLYRYDDRWSFSTWIYRIAINVYKSEHKKRKKYKGCSSDDLPDIPCSLEYFPELAYETKEFRQEIISLINGLKKEQKIALVLKHIESLSFKEIGDILGISPEAAKMKVQRAKQTLCKRFEQLQKGGVYREMQI